MWKKVAGDGEWGWLVLFDFRCVQLAMINKLVTVDLNVRESSLFYIN